MLETIPASVIGQFWELIIVLIVAIIAYIENEKKEKAIAETAQLAAFYDPATGNVPPPASVPKRAWTMDDETKKWVTAGHTETEKVSLLLQVAEAEAKGLTSYFISCPTAFYEIEFGLIKGSGKGLSAPPA